MRIIEGHDYTFPVIGYERRNINANRVATPKNVYGTAFSVGDNCFLTAGHSIENALSENDVLAVGFIDGESYFAAEALDHEVIAELDTGIIKTIAQVSRAKQHQWQHEPLASLIDVGASGYPYALDPDRNSLASRSFKGYVVSRTRTPFSANPWGYELSFACPRGLSGAPLTTLGDFPLVAGLVVGNRSTEMNIFSDREVISDDKEIIVERYEALQLGIAIQSAELMTLRSRILEGELREHLQKHLLIAETVPPR